MLGAGDEVAPPPAEVGETPGAAVGAAGGVAGTVHPGICGINGGNEDGIKPLGIGNGNGNCGNVGAVAGAVPVGGADVPAPTGAV